VTLRVTPYNSFRIAIILNQFMNLDYSFTRYLTAKTTVDERALNQQVWQSLIQRLPTATPDKPLRIIEVGAGIGTMVERMLEHRLLTHAIYTAIDIHPPNIQVAKERLQTVSSNVKIELEAIDIFEFVAREQGQKSWDLLIAHAFLDLMHVPTTLPILFSLLRPNGLFYLTLNFDGATILQPTLDANFDAQVETLYHRTMDKRMINGQPSGDSQTGRHLFQHLPAFGAEILAAGSSDWLVFSGQNGYPADEAYFLHFIINTIHQALAEQRKIDKIRLKDWIAQRHLQIKQGELVYIAHQIDFLGKI
jgi:2-polyprenyl-3-methyl-5-hydroxy-6-metoxy-1,4-benzoquinol methylase